MIGPAWMSLILWLPAVALVACGVCWAWGVRTKLPAWLTCGCLGGAFVLTLIAWLGYEEPLAVPMFEWMAVPGAAGLDFVANFALHVDGLTLLWMLFVTGLGTLITLYASEYMEEDLGPGYCRFFAGMSVFLFAMTALVMADNLLVLYLGWEGVGFASYWLIGYYSRRPASVAAAKKAFIVNRIGDVGLALAVYLTWSTLGTLDHAVIFETLEAGEHAEGFAGWPMQAVPWLLMLAAFGKSAQLPLYVWLPDAMEGPTPVSALIHAATMVTAGVYLVARMFPVFLLDPTSLHVVAWVGGLTALLGATIAMAQHDIKRIFAYSTISQLGYMFMGLGLVTTFGAAFHVFTHAFFKAALFLTAGAIMHGFAGQLDLRRISGLVHRPGWRITSWTMLIGCLCLAGLPLTSGYFSKDAILAQAFLAEGPGFKVLGWIAIATAGLTAYYAFRVWFRVCTGPEHGEPGPEHDGDEPFHPHAPRAVINTVLVLLGAGSLLAALPLLVPNVAEGVHGGWVADMIASSSAAEGLPGLADHGAEAHGTLLGLDPHAAMYGVSAVVALAGTLIAFRLHLWRRDEADALRARLLARPATRWLPVGAHNKWYVDESYHVLLRAPLWVLGHVLNLLDRVLVDGLLVDGTARLPRLMARWFQPLHNGVVQAYAVSMIGGAALVILLMLVLPELVQGLGWLTGGGG